MPEGYVALLDVLGFSALINGPTSDQRIADYLETLQRVTEQTAVKFAVFSDSIVLTADGSDTKSFLTLSAACSQLFAAFLPKNIAVRGAIAFGNVVRTRVGDSIFVAGRAVVEAYRYEKEQNWVGIMLAPSVYEAIPDLVAKCQVPESATPESLRDLVERLPWAGTTQRYESIPFHRENPVADRVQDGFVVVPTSPPITARTVRNSIREALAHLERLEIGAPDPSAQSKYLETIRWLRLLVGRWNHVAEAL